MKVEVEKVKMTKSVIKSIIEIDKEFYTDFDFSNEKNLNWYYDRYSAKNEIFVLKVNNVVAGYFLFVSISKKLFDEILHLKHFEDWTFSPTEFNQNTEYFYIPSIVVKKEYRQFALPLLRRLKQEAENKPNLVVITVTQEGHRLASNMLNYIGKHPQKDICIYAKTEK